MSKRNQRGQGLVEFALILPLLLLLLLGIIEGARVIVAYITVQNAARESARYAVTGRPFACPGDPVGSFDWQDYCDDPTQGDPWSPQVLTTTRVAAIKNAATEQIPRVLAVSLFADGDLVEYNANKTVPGAFGVAVIGQSGTYTQGLANFGGDPGWNVRVETYYNVEMIDPIFRTIMGGQTIHLGGQVELQNEGIDATAKEYTGGITFQSDSCAPNCGGSQIPFITVQDEFGDFTEPAGGNFTVSVNDHQPNTAYKLWFVDTASGFSENIDFTTDGLGSKLLTFIISVSAPATSGPDPSYKIYTTLAGNTSPVASCLGDLPTNAPCFSVETGNPSIEARNKNEGDQQQQPVFPARWPISSSIPIYLFGHNVNDSYVMKFNGQTSTSAPGTLMFQGSAVTQIPTDNQYGTNKDNSPAYYIATGHSVGDLIISSEDLGGTEIATTTVKIVEASLEIAGETPTSKHPAGDILGIVLRNFAPLQQYLFYFDDGVTPPATVRADENGELALNYVIPYGVQTPGDPPVPVEIFAVDYNRGPVDLARKIASRTILVETPVGPYLNVPGGARWPAGSPITIQVRRHLPNTEYGLWLQQGPASAPTFSMLINDATFTTSVDPITGLGEYDMSFTIPFTLAGFFTIRSFEPGAPTTEVAAFDLEVTAQPYITIDNGKRWPPGATIVIRLHDHAVNRQYEVWLDKGGSQEALLGTVIIDSNGDGTLTYTIPQNMPTKIEPGYNLHSYLNGVLAADNADLEIMPADLQVTNIDVPNVTFDVEIPITLTISNNNPVTITNTYFDTDMYIDPGSAPNPLDNGLPPGEYKNWVNNVPPNGSVTVEDSIVLFGQQNHQIYARADTSNYISEDVEGNNVTLKNISASCPVELFDEFPGDGLAEWTQTDFGDSGPSCPTLPDLPPVTGGGTELLNITWPSNNGNLQGFTVQADPPYPAYFGTSGTNFYSGTSSGGNPVSALYVGPRGRTSSNSSAGAYIEFTNTQPDVTIAFDYLLRLRKLDSNEWAEYYFIIDSTAAGGGVQAYDGGTGNSYLLRAVGNGRNWQDHPVGFNGSWPRATINLTLPVGTHRLLVAAKTSPMNQRNEYALAYIDNLLVTESSGPPATPSDPPGTIWSAHFDTGTESFTFAPNTFLGLTSNPPAADPTGTRVTDAGATGSTTASLYTKLGRTSGSTAYTDMTGGWSRTFTVPAGGGCVTIQGYYRLKFSGLYESNEQGEVLLAVDDGSSPRILTTVQGGSGAVDSGWVAFNQSFSLTPGSHTLILGGHNNQATQDGEITEIWFDDVYVVDTGSGTATSSQSESSGVLTMSNRGSDALSADDNGSGAGYHFMHQTVGSGPFEAYVRLDQTALNGSNGRAGLEIRADSSGTAAKLMFVFRSDNRLQVLSRVSGASAVSERTQSLGSVLPIWLRITRNGDQFDFSYSTSNSDVPPDSWTNFKTVSNFTLPDSVEVGLINAPASGSTNYPAQFKHFHVCASSAPGGSAGTGGGFLGNRCGEVAENGNGLVVIDAVNTILNQSGGGHTWQTVTANDVLGEPSMEGLEASPDSGANLSPGATSPHATYQVNVDTGGTYYVWVAGWGPNAGGNDVHVGLNGAAVGIVDGFPTGGSSPAWVKMPGSISVSAGINTVDLWAKEDGARIFKILLTTDSAFVPPPDGMAQSACTIIAQPHIPPLYQQCTNPIRRGDFEGTFLEVDGEWETSSLATVYSTVSYQSNHGAGLPTFGGRKPAIYQTFDLPTWILSNTTAILDLKKGVDLQGTSNPEDKLYFALRRDSDNFDLIPPILLATGEDLQPEIPDLDPFDPAPDQWTTFNQDIFAGLNPLSFLEPGGKVRVYLYSPDPGVNTSFFLDNVSLTFCTTQPEPPIVSGTGKISGKTQRFGQPLIGATVWAYAYADEGSNPGPVFKTYSIQDGTYRFYNLPPGKYLVYAQITDASGTFFDSRLVEVTAGGEVKNVILVVETS